MGRYYRHDEVFPVIARIIDEFSQGSTGYVKHDKIVNSMLVEPELQIVLDRRPKHRSRDSWASNMVQWFSEKITMGQSKWRYDFDRQQVDGKWEYRSKQPGFLASLRRESDG